MINCKMHRLGFTDVTREHFVFLESISEALGGNTNHNHTPFFLGKNEGRILGVAKVVFFLNLEKQFRKQIYTLGTTMTNSKTSLKIQFWWHSPCETSDYCGSEKNI